MCCRSPPSACGERQEALRPVNTESIMSERLPLAQLPSHKLDPQSTAIAAEQTVQGLFEASFS